ncbi:MAG: peptidylprolyl isomerase [Fibrobacter sp.]|nr:peptidylprolyl isomerase [Fibrobacter sp.]
MLTWINEKAKWIIVIFAAGIAVGLLAMDRVPNMAQSHPVAEVQGKKIPYAEFEVAVKNLTDQYQAQAEAQGQRLDDEQYNQIHNRVFNEFVAKTVLEDLYKDAGILTSDSEVVQEFLHNSNAVRQYMVQEIQGTIAMMQQQSASQEEFMQKYNGYLASLPDFIKDTTFNQAEYEAWVRREAGNWASLRGLEEQFVTSVIPMRQLQFLIGAGAHTTSLEAQWSANRRLTDYELQVAVASAADFAADANSVDSAAVKAYFDAHQDSFFVKNDVAQFVYAYLPIKATEGDEKQILDYAKTNIYEALVDSSSPASFEDMAKSSSEDPSTAANGGKLGRPAGLGLYVPEFEQAALALDSGKISAPIRSQYGYHIIKCYGKTTDSTGKVTADVGHILLTVGASSQTVDSLEKLLTGIKNDVDAGKSFDEAAKSRNVATATSKWLARNENIAEVGFLKGLGFYAWPNKILPEESSKLSPVMKNNNWVAVAMKVGDIKAGTRSMDYFYSDIKNAILQEKAVKAAEAHLNSVAEKVKAANFEAPDASIEKVKLDKKTASVDGYVPGFAYGSAEIAKAFKSVKDGEWSPVTATENGAVLFKIVSKKAPSEESIKAEVASEKGSASLNAAMAFNEFTKNLVGSAKVVNNMDLFYRD